jgi:nucleotide-binding universal stress UspA family protein
MTQRIVVALDPDAIADEAIELGHTLACATGARLTLLAVAHSWEEDGEDRRARADEELARVRERLRERGNDDVAAHALAARSVERTLERAAAREDTGLVVLGPTHRRPRARGTAARFLHGAACPIAVAPAGYRDPERGLDRIGVAFTDSPDGLEALRGAVALARWSGARLRVIAVAELAVPQESLVMPGAAIEDVLRNRRSALRDALTTAVAEHCEGVECETVVFDGDAATSLAAASRVVDLLVCGSRGHGRIGSVLLGSVSRPLLDRAACPLLVVPRGREPRLESLVAPHSAAAG